MHKCRTASCTGFASWFASAGPQFRVTSSCQMFQHSLGLPETKGVVCSQIESITAVYQTVPIRSDRFACPTLGGDRERTQPDNLWSTRQESDGSMTTWAVGSYSPSLFTHPVHPARFSRPTSPILPIATATSPDYSGKPLHQLASEARGLYYDYVQGSTDRHQPQSG